MTLNQPVSEFSCEVFRQHIDFSVFFFYSEGILLDSRLFNFLSSIPHQVIFHLEKEKVVRLILSIHRYERVDIENNFLMRIYNVKIVRGRDYFLKSC